MRSRLFLAALVIIAGLGGVATGQGLEQGRRRVADGEGAQRSQIVNRADPRFRGFERERNLLIDEFENER